MIRPENILFEGLHQFGPKIFVVNRRNHSELEAERSPGQLFNHRIFSRLQSFVIRVIYENLLLDFKVSHGVVFLS
jgi:hypothetical protein